MRKALFLFLVILSAGAYGQVQKIKNTETFISYFTSIKEIKDYFILKDSIEAAGTRAKNNPKINTSSKLILESLYDTVQSKSEALYNKIVRDLLNKAKREDIKNNPDAYVQSINGYFENIKLASNEFNSKYKEILGDAKGFVIIFAILKFLLPVVEDFVNEMLDDLVRQKLDKYLKPKIVIKPWASLPVK
jgi:hypothetical protein